MRSGTTSLNGYLREHPDIAVSTPKEVHFFDLHFERGVDWYGEHFAAAAGATAIGEATPDYLYHPEAMARIAATLPDVKIVITLRNPIDRAYSHYWHNHSRSVEHLSFEDAIAAEPDRIAAEPESRRRFSYIDRGRYRSQLERLLEVIPRERVLVDTFDRLNADPGAVYARACEFLGVDPSFIPPNLGVAINAYIPIRSPRLRELTKPLPRKVRNLIGRLNRERSTGYPEMPDHVRAHLAAGFRDANTALDELLGMPIPDWN